MHTDTHALDLARRYFDHWTQHRYDAAAALLSPDLEVEVPVNRYPDRASFAQALSGFGSMVKKSTLLGEYERGREAVLVYDLEVEVLGIFRVAEQFTVEGGRITKIRQIHDTHAVRKAGFAPAGGRSIADPAQGLALAAAELACPPDRIFPMLTGEAITRWWVRPTVFDTRDWEGDARVGGHWRASGIGRGNPYALEGDFLEIDAPRKLVHTWRAVGAPGEPSMVTYLLEPIEAGTRILVRHTGLPAAACENTAIGWETSLDRLAEILV